MKRIVLSFYLLNALIIAPMFARSGGHSHSASHSSGRVTHVKGYTKKNGKYVAPYDRTKSNGTQTDNWSAKGNVNPETGKAGTKDSSH